MERLVNVVRGREYFVSLSKLLVYGFNSNKDEYPALAEGQKPRGQSLGWMGLENLFKIQTSGGGRMKKSKNIVLQSLIQW